MPLVNVMVNSRAYTIACDEGEEEHLKVLAAHVDEKVRELLGTVGQVGDQRLLLMAALLIADENHDLAERLEAHSQRAGEFAASQAEASERTDKSETAAADALESAAKKLEDVAARLAHA
jgi:cell division protein ZapA